MWSSYNHFGVVNQIIIYVKLLLKIDELFEIWSHFQFTQYHFCAAFSETSLKSACSSNK